MTKLIVLFLRNNSFAGDVPSLSKLQKLEVLDLDHNKLTSLPADICSLPAGVFSKSNCGSDWGGSNECCLSNNLFRCTTSRTPPSQCTLGCDACVCDGDNEELCALSEIWLQANGRHVLDNVSYLPVVSTY